MGCISGKVIHAEASSISQGGKPYQSGVMEFADGTIQDFVLFDGKESFSEGDYLQLTGSTKSGTFMANWLRKKDTTVKVYAAPPIVRIKRGDEIDGKPPIEWLMDKLGGGEVERRLRLEFGGLSDILKNGVNREKYKKLIAKWIEECRNPLHQAIPDVF